MADEITTGCTDPEAYNCADDDDWSTYIMDGEGTMFDNSCNWDWNISTWEAEYVGGCESNPCEGYYNPAATIDDGSCRYYQAPQSEDMEITFGDYEMTIDWSEFSPPINSNVEYYIINYQINNSDGSHMIWDILNTNSVLPTSAITMYMGVKYSNNPYWGWAISDFTFGCTDSEASNYNPDATLDNGNCYLLGDINGDSIINVIDIVMAVDLILNGNYDVVADVNEDGQLNVIDIVILVDWVLNGGTATSICDGLTEVELWGEYYDIETTTEILLWGQGLSGEIPPEIGCLTNLQWLDLGFNELTGELPSEIGNLTNLIDLYLRNNQLTGEIPPEVCDLIENNNLYMDNILEGNNLTNTCD